ncbi:MAG TPA: type ISP restriction/modification enzyme, partial [Caulobacteraceae bacterium]|nr:type ISP restriction/modification enzyme [Caulobacteraceae bacterium]
TASDDEKFAQAISAFGAAATAALSNPAISGDPEDQLRAPLVTLVKALAPLSGLGAYDAQLVGETRLADLTVRPDFAVTRNGVLIGFIEVKAPGKGADPTRFKAKHDKDQWEKLKALPNLIYTDGNAFSLWQDGERAMPIVRLDGDVESSGSRLAAPPELGGLFTAFYGWRPIPPRTPRQLAETTARLCRLLRDEVSEQLDRKAPGLTSLAEDWRKLLFPAATDAEFADGYAQAVTFGLLMARARNIPLAGGIEEAAKVLRRSNSLIGSALRLLTEEVDDAHTLDTSLKTLTAVLDVVDWARLSKGEPEAWLYFYELFLQQYDTALRKRTGSYYTPPQVVTAMVRLVDEALRAPGRFDLIDGLASPEVSLADPAVGTGTFLLGVLQRIRSTVEARDGAGAVPAAITASLSRLIGFELQFGPFAVAQLRVLAELIELVTLGAGDASEELQKALSTDLRLYITDTLSDPDEETAWIPSNLAGVAESRRQANRIKRHEPITVVMGNPPYKEKAKGHGGWVENRGRGVPAPLDDWQPPVSWGVGAHTKHLRNLYIYFWRWAAWKVFGGNAYRSGTDATPADWTRRKGIVAFITVAGFLNGPGFQKMRADLRRDAEEIWVIDCSPEGHQPPASSRIFQGVQQPVCIVIASRPASADKTTAANVRFRSLPEGDRDEKFTALANLGLDDAGWVEALSDWRAPFLPAGAADWAAYPAVEDLFLYNGSGVMTGRTWVIAPDAQSLRERWDRLIREKDSASKEALFHPQTREGKVASRHIRKLVPQAVGPRNARPMPIISESGPLTAPTLFAFRSFDRQWLIPDARLINDVRPQLWNRHSDRQVYLTGLLAHSPIGGPALTISALVPDLHHYKGSFGGRVFPLWADRTADRPNISPGLLSELSLAYGREVAPEEVMAYIAAVAAHPGYVERFRANLKQPGLRIPVTADRALFDEAAAVGREVIWLHTFGERFVEGRPPGAPRVEPRSAEPTLPADGVLPTLLDDMPHDLDYDAATHRLKIGTGYIANVAPAVWAYEVSGKRVLTQWWSYRRKDRSKPPMGDKRPPSKLSEIQPDNWLPEYTTELLNVLRVLTRLVALEPQQDDLLRRITEGPTISADVLSGAGALTDSSAAEEQGAEPQP